MKTIGVADVDPRVSRFGVFRRSTTILIAGASVVAIASCSASSDAEPVAKSAVSGPLSSIPEEQRAAFEDGVIDLAEYQSAFQSFLDCANRDDEMVIDVRTDPTSGVISYATRAELSVYGPSNGSELDDCYRRLFLETEATFQTSDPTAVAQGDAQSLMIFRRDILPCLTKQGIKVPSEVQPGTPVFGQLVAQGTELINNGTCKLE